MNLHPGLRLASTVCATSVVVIRAPSTPIDLRCGGAPMVPHDAKRASTGAPEPALCSGTLMGKRYWDAASDLEVMCTTPGAGSLSLGEEPLPMKPTKPLPSSD